MAAKDRFVSDCSVALAWCFPDEKAPYPQSVLDSLTSAEAVVPSVWPLEVANALLVGERRKRCDRANVVAWIALLRALPIRVDDQTTAQAWGDTLGLARTHNLSVYDAAYLELALRLVLPLATLDGRLQTAAAAVGVSRYQP
jgi:predicted nucleic acid-binding protein